MLTINTNESGYLNRADAIQILREIIKVCGENSSLIRSVSLMAPFQENGVTGYQLKIGTKLDNTCRSSLMPLLNDKKLAMQENKDSIIIFKSK